MTCLLRFTSLRRLRNAIKITMPILAGMKMSLVALTRFHVLVTLLVFASTPILVSHIARGAAIKIAIPDRENLVNVAQAAVDIFKNETGHQVEILPIPGGDSYLKQLIESHLLRQNDSGIDLFVLNAAHVAELSELFLNLKTIDPKIGESIVASLMSQVASPQGQVYAYPLQFSVPILYYRSDLLDKYGEKPPRTWSELEEISSRIMQAEAEQGRQIWGYIFSGAGDNDLISVVMELIAGHDGGQIIDGDGNINFISEEAISALERAASWINRITPKEVITLDERDVSEYWSQGKSIFMRHTASGVVEIADSWTKAVAMPTENVGIPPQASMVISTIAIAKESNKSQVALELIKLMARPDIQMILSENAGWLATDQSTLIKLASGESATGLFEAEGDVFANPFSRQSGSTRYYSIILESYYKPLLFPTFVVGAGYSDVLHEISIAVHSILRKTGAPRSNANKLQQRLTNLRSQNWRK